MTYRRRPVLLALTALFCTVGTLAAGDLYSDKEPAKLPPLVLPKPSEVQALTVMPKAVTLKGLDDANQLVLTAALADGKLQDLTGDAAYQVADPKIARVTS